MNTMQEALNKAGIKSNDFKDNEKYIYSGFPFIRKWRSILPTHEGYVEKFKWKKDSKSRVLSLWVGKQNKQIINFLKNNKERIYVFPTEKCCKMLEAWIGYDSKHQRFVIRVNPLAQSYCPYGVMYEKAEKAKTNSIYAGRLFTAIMKDLPIFGSMTIDQLCGLSYSQLLNLIPANKIQGIIRKAFSTGIIPVEMFDPIKDISSIAFDNTITIESTNINDILESLKDIKDALDETKLNAELVNLYCGFNNIKALDVTSIADKKGYYNLIFAKDVSQKGKKKQPDRSFFIIV